MDPLSIVAGVTGLLAFAGAIVSKGYSSLSRFKDAKSEIELILNETAAVSGVLSGLKSMLDLNSAAPLSIPGVEQVLRDAEATLSEISSLLDTVAQAGRVSTLLKGDARGKSLKRFVERLQNYKSFFALAIQVQQSDRDAAVERQIEEIGKNLAMLNMNQARAEKNVQILVGQDSLLRRDTIIRWLGPTTEAEHDDLCKQRDGESCRWVLEKFEFQTWAGSRSSAFLWLNGERGSGKSVVVSKIVETIQDTFSAAPGFALLYHYCRFSNETCLSPAVFLGSFAGQLLRQLPNPALALELVGQLYDKHQKFSTRPSQTELEALFFSVVRHFSSVSIIIDGIDELPDRWDLVEFLRRLLEREECFRVLVASRQEPDLWQDFSSFTSITVTPEDTSNDLERFVQSKLRRNRLLRPRMKELTDELVSQAGGMFLWAACQVDLLVQVRAAASLDTMKKLPRSLERMFEAMLSRLSEDDKALAQTILGIVVYARPPLDAAELVEAVAVGETSNSLEDVRRSRLESHDDIFDICAGLIRKSRATKKVELSHFSVFEFLRSRSLQDGRPNPFYAPETQSYRELLSTSLTYLRLGYHYSQSFYQALDDDSFFEFFSASPFLAHATSRWPSYYLKISEPERADELRELCEDFLPSALFDFWVHCARYLHGAHRYFPGITVLHTAAIHGLADVARQLLATSCPAMYCTVSTKTPLHVAIALHSNPEIIRPFVQAPFLDVLDEEHLAPLHVALRCCNMAATKLLMEAGADMGRVDGEGRTAAFIMIENGWFQFSDHVLSSIDVDFTMPDGRTYLHVACQAGSLAWVTKLLAFVTGRGNREKADDSGWTPLHYAVENGHGKVVSLLLSKGVCVAPKDVAGWTPLHSAIRHRRLSCAKALLRSSNPREPAPSPSSHGSTLLPPRPRIRSSVAWKYGEWSGGGSGPSGVDGSSTAAEAPSPRIDFQGPTSSGEHHNAKSPLFIATTSQYFDGVELLVSEAESEASNKAWIGVGDQSCIRAAATLPDQRILHLLLRRWPPNSIGEFMWQQTTEDLAVVLERAKDALDANFAHRHVLPMALDHLTTRSRLRSPPGSAADTTAKMELLLRKWPLRSSETLPADILHRVARADGIPESCLIGKDLIEAGGDLFHELSDPWIPRGTTPLHTAISLANWGFVELLIPALVQKGLPIVWKRSPIHHIFERRPRPARKACDISAQIQKSGLDFQAVPQALLGFSLDPNADPEFLSWLISIRYIDPTGPDGGQALSQAIGKQSLQKMRVILRSWTTTRGAPSRLLEILTCSRDPPLHGTARHAWPEGFNAVLEAMEEAVKVAKTVMDDDSLRVIKRRQDCIFSKCLLTCLHARPVFDLGARALVCRMSSFSTTDFHGNTALHLAVLSNSIELARLMLDKGARLDTKANGGKTAFDMAKDAQMADMVVLLAKHDASLASQATDVAARAETARLRPALRDARERGDRKKELEILATGLLGEYAEDGIERDAYGDTCLHRAVRSKDSKELSRLAQTCARHVLLAEDLSGYSPLMQATMRAYWDGAKILIRAGSSVAEAIEQSKGCPSWVKKLEELAGEVWEEEVKAAQAAREMREAERANDRGSSPAHEDLTESRR